MNTDYTLHGMHMPACVLGRLDRINRSHSDPANVTVNEHYPQLHLFPIRHFMSNKVDGSQVKFSLLSNNLIETKFNVSPLDFVEITHTSTL